MITGQWNPHENQKDNRGFTSIADIVNDIADRALGGFDDFTDDCTTYPRTILNWYMSEDCPEPLNAEVYQQVMRDNDERVYRAIWRRIHSRLT
tara:strand:- start:1619 stop:1897 length:279 start_codon:yes stop_codon:yes gene_type:complete